jgi:hypothetical protein
MRGVVIVLAMLFVVASAGTILCETNCAAGDTGASAAGMPDGSMNVATSHCAGKQTESMQLNMPAPHGNSGGNTKHSGAHSHVRIVATVTAEVQTLSATTVSYFSVTPVISSAAIFSRADQNFLNNNSSPPTNFPSVFSTGVLRI